ncbi:hypothetical protein CBR_g50678 [Chara braunii]|uniref:Myb-like domain-containing protein n=1 Tax=Chara braunii TaxID=69332 RepID=A0A388M774_CHABU|nr:hypothetical protein CBR_g50678 [Chara braunii]|eukprot:GBG90431.1 hypothetical protein CBR_g50678 [Chara braunii]
MKDHGHWSAIFQQLCSRQFTNVEGTRSTGRSIGFRIDGVEEGCAWRGCSSFIGGGGRRSTSSKDGVQDEHAAMATTEVSNVSAMACRAGNNNLSNARAAVGDLNYPPAPPVMAGAMSSGGCRGGSGQSFVEDRLELEDIVGQEECGGDGICAGGVCNAGGDQIIVCGVAQADGTPLTAADATAGEQDGGVQKAKSAPKKATKKSGKTPNKRDDETLLLLTLRCAYKAAREEDSEAYGIARSGTKLWKEISKNLIAAGFNRTRDMCKNRWKYVYCNYKDIIDNDKRSGRKSYWDMEVETRVQNQLDFIMRRAWFDHIDKFDKRTQAINPEDITESHESGGRGGSMVSGAGGTLNSEGRQSGDVETTPKRDPGSSVCAGKDGTSAGGSGGGSGGGSAGGSAGNANTGQDGMSPGAEPALRRDSRSSVITGQDGTRAGGSAGNASTPAQLPTLGKRKRCAQTAREQSVQTITSAMREQ